MLDGVWVYTPLDLGVESINAKVSSSREKEQLIPLVEKYLSRITFDLQARKIIVVIHFSGSINALARWVDGRCSAT